MPGCTRAGTFSEVWGQHSVWAGAHPGEEWCNSLSVRRPGAGPERPCYLNTFSTFGAVVGGRWQVAHRLVCSPPKTRSLTVLPLRPSPPSSRTPPHRQLWNSEHEPARVEAACRKSLADLKVGRGGGGGDRGCVNYRTAGCSADAPPSGRPGTTVPQAPLCAPVTSCLMPQPAGDTAATPHVSLLYHRP